MHDFSALGKMLVIFGILMAAIGGLIIATGRMPGIGRLSGDIYIQRKNFTFYFPLASSLIISVILSLLFWFIFRSK